MAVVTALPTTPGWACHVPNPTEGILAPVFNSKNRIEFAISDNNTQTHAVRDLGALYTTDFDNLSKNY